MTEKIRLLIVDDEKEFLEALGERLEMREFEVHEATGGIDALAACSRENFDIALVDLKMPGMDGQELLIRLKEEDRFLEIIILTGHGSLGSAVECTKLGAFSYLPKPYDLEELLKVLQAAYTERLKKKFADQELRIQEIMDLAQGSSPLTILRRMKKLDQE
ncbi:MAG: response regulator [Gemmatimonadales bacterium]|nr:response regulator [Gemmatimonadales bacterium]